MHTIVLISCVSKKVGHPAKAKDLYVSPLFQLCLRYAHSLHPDNIFVLSAKYGLVELDQVLAPYNETLNTMGDREIWLWASGVLDQLRARADLDGDRFMFLAGEKYRRHLIPHIRHYEIPMEGLTIGRQLQFLTKVLDHERM